LVCRKRSGENFSTPTSAGRAANPSSAHSSEGSMSDVAIAPSAPPSGSGASEVAVPTEHTSLPNPVGSQAPDKPVGDVKGSEHRPASRRETIKAAFDRATNAEPARPRMGHNNPPEAMQRERSAPSKAETKNKANERGEGEKLDLKKKPSEQPAGEKSPRERGEHGHFAGRNQNAEQPAQRANPLPEGTPFRDPPQRMSQQARAEWHKTPEPVRADIHRMHTEFGRAYAQYRGDHEHMNTIRPFAHLARESGTTLQRALTSYVGMEEKLRNDPVAGLDQIVNNLNLRTPQGQKLSLRDVAWHIVNQTPEQQQLVASNNRQMAQTHQLHQMQQHIRDLEIDRRRMHYAARFHQTRAGVDQYATTHPRLDELGDLIEREIKLGFDLDTAYRRAELLRPASTAAQTRNGTAAQTRAPTPAQTRTSDRSISGAPGANGSAASRKQPVSRREALANAMRRASN